MFKRILLVALAITYNTTYTCDYFNNNCIRENQTSNNKLIFETLKNSNEGPVFTIEYKPSNKKYHSTLFDSTENKPYKPVCLNDKMKKPFLFDFDINIYKNKNELLNKKRKRTNNLAKYKKKNNSKLYVEDIMDIDLNNNGMALDEEAENAKWEKLNTQYNNANYINKKQENIFKVIFNTENTQDNNSFDKLFESLSLNNK